MSRKLALKRFRASDLSMFKAYLAKHGQTKQKGFNLDKKVMEGVFYPSLWDDLETLDRRAAHVDLLLFGPGPGSPESLARKVKRDAKNFRLNGEAIDSPIGDPTRYDDIKPGDFAIMEFTGAPLPTALKVVLVSANEQADASLHAAFEAFFPDRPRVSLKALDEEDIRKLIKTGRVASSHPIADWVDSDLLEEVANGDALATERLNAKRGGRGVNPVDFKRAKQAAERVGQLGEELLDQYFETGKCVGLLTHSWASAINAVSPFDFQLEMTTGVRHVDAKSTAGPFGNPIYLSAAEIRHAIGSGVPYDIFRLYEVKDESALFKVARDIGPQLLTVLEAIDRFPVRTKVDSISFDPSFFSFEPDEGCIRIDGESDDE